VVTVVPPPLVPPAPDMAARLDDPALPLPGSTLELAPPHASAKGRTTSHPREAVRFEKADMVLGGSARHL